MNAAMWSSAWFFACVGVVACGNPTYVGGDGGEPVYSSYTNDLPTDGGNASFEDGGGGICNHDAGPAPDFTAHKACTVAGQCDALLHEVDCCGNVVAVGIRDPDLGPANAQENAWKDILHRNCRGCAPCDAGPMRAENGNSGTTYQLTCTAMACMTTIP